MEYAPLVESGGLETSVLGVQFLLEPLGNATVAREGGRRDDVIRLPASGARLNCTAAIGSVYWKSTSWTLRLHQDKLTETLPAAATSSSPSSPYAFIPSCSSVAFLLPFVVVAVNKHQ